LVDAYVSGAYALTGVGVRLPLPARREHLKRCSLLLLGDVSPGWIFGFLPGWNKIMQQFCWCAMPCKGGSCYTCGRGQKDHDRRLGVNVMLALEAFKAKEPCCTFAEGFAALGLGWNGKTKRGGRLKF